MTHMKPIRREQVIDATSRTGAPRVLTEELHGSALTWAVAKGHTGADPLIYGDGAIMVEMDGFEAHDRLFPTTGYRHFVLNWDCCGPVMEQNWDSISTAMNAQDMTGTPLWTKVGGADLLEHLMRAYVAKTFGPEMDIPDKLVVANNLRITRDTPVSRFTAAVIDTNSLKHFVTATDSMQVAMRDYVLLANSNFGQMYGVGSHAALTDEKGVHNAARLYEGRGVHSFRYQSQETMAMVGAMEPGVTSQIEQEREAIAKLQLSLGQVLTEATDADLVALKAVVESMLPVDAVNPFWLRHELPQQRIVWAERLYPLLDFLTDRVDQIQPGSEATNAERRRRIDAMNVAPVTADLMRNSVQKALSKALASRTVPTRLQQWQEATQQTAESLVRLGWNPGDIAEHLAQVSPSVVLPEEKQHMIEHMQVQLQRMVIPNALDGRLDPEVEPQP